MKVLQVMAVCAVLQSAAQARTWNLTTLYSFPGGSKGLRPNSIIFAKGALFGTTAGEAEASCANDNCGNVWKLAPPSTSGGAWAYTVILNIADRTTQLAQPTSVTMAASGSLFGTAYGGGSDCGMDELQDCGGVFELTPGSGGWTETVLVDFGVGGSNGEGSTGQVLVNSRGDVFGTIGNRAIELIPPSETGGAWTEDTLYAFGGGVGSGYNLVAGPGNVFYGQTAGGGAYGMGSVYQLTPPAVAGGAWTEETLYSFQGGTDGSNPTGPLAIGSTGTLYGTTNNGGDPTCLFQQDDEYPGCGTVYELTPPATAGGAWTETVLYSFTDGTDGGYPANGVVIGSGGVLYGTTLFGGGTASCYEACGTVFNLKPPAEPGGAWTESVLYAFTDSSTVSPKVVLGAGGVLYGVTEALGASDSGQVFELTAP